MTNQELTRETERALTLLSEIEDRLSRHNVNLTPGETDEENFAIDEIEEALDALIHPVKCAISRVQRLRRA